MVTTIRDYGDGDGDWEQFIHYVETLDLIIPVEKGWSKCLQTSGCHSTLTTIKEVGFNNRCFGNIVCIVL